LPLRVQGPGPMLQAGFAANADPILDYRGTLSYDRPRYRVFLEAMQDRGIRLIGRGLWYVSAAHTEDDIDHAVATAGAVLAEMAREGR
jgi:glutamate-1-semialdehyde 2,1-aminomutase